MALTRVMIKLWLAGVAGLVLAGEPVRPSGPDSLASLRDAIQRHATQARFARAHWGIHVVSRDTGEVLFTANADKSFVPASTAKLFTGALALDQLGPEHRVRTSLYAGAPPDPQGVVKGDLVLYGRGDPSLSPAAAGGDWDRALAPLVEALVAAGVRVVTGDLGADESHFRGPPLGSGWEYDDLSWYYGAEVSALSVNLNALDVIVRPAASAGLPAQVFLFPSTRYVVISNLAQTVAADVPRRLHVRRVPEQNVVIARGKVPLGARPVTESVAVRRPAAWLGHELKAALHRRGIAVRGSVVVVDAEARDRAPLDHQRLVELGGTWSPPLRDRLPRMMKPSQNLLAQLLLLEVGAALPAAASELTTEQAGLRALPAFLARAGLTPGEARLEEGSGLSRHNLVTPRALVALLEFMLRHPHAEVFTNSLPVAGVDGTLRTRLRGSAAEGNLHGKTGTLSGVNSLAGYVTTVAGEPLVFALMLNHYTGGPGDRPARAELDELAGLVAGLGQHTREVKAKATAGSAVP
ncbi:MAG: D-alanyl-D-alanine carboxypeptidase/D-alanyl-D-alanine-endopeptidase [Verrucomicrobiales bacterium]|nr:D-alanyl-D-alanine carboxypeptidase/D-alanyl-D-alanine-endopeptidase [Verrucomicrobiales bacterium]